MLSKKILIAAGGTGGHIYPALAIADAFKNARPDFQIEFVGTAHGLENKIIPARGFRLHHLPIGRLNSNVPIGERLLTILKLPVSILKSALILVKEKPSFVLGVGGHASGPLLLAAALLRYPNAIWEPNAMPGLANRWLSYFVDDCWVVFNEARLFLKSRSIHEAGMPVRQEIEKVQDVNVSEPFRILIFGGSQGARGINNAVVEMIRLGGDWLKGVHIVHQTGPADFQRIKESYGSILESGLVEIKEYIHDMANQYAHADLVVARSGTGTLSELAACGKPAILIPLPTAADDHQRKNAESLVQKGAAQMILQKDLKPEGLRDAVQNLRLNSPERRQMSERIRKFHHPHAAEKLVGEFLQRIEAHAAS